MQRQELQVIVILYSIIPTSGQALWYRVMKLSYPHHKAKNVEQFYLLTYENQELVQLAWFCNFTCQIHIQFFFKNRKGISDKFNFNYTCWSKFALLTSCQTEDNFCRLTWILWSRKSSIQMVQPCSNKSSVTSCFHLQE